MCEYLILINILPRNYTTALSDAVIILGSIKPSLSTLQGYPSDMLGAGLRESEVLWTQI